MTCKLRLRSDDIAVLKAEQAKEKAANDRGKELTKTRDKAIATDHDVTKELERLSKKTHRGYLAHVR